MIKELFLALQSIILAEGTFVHFDWWNDQPTEEDDATAMPYPTPAVLVEFVPLTTQDLAQGAQLVELAIRLHVVGECYAQGGSYLPDEQGEFLSTTDLADRLHVLLTRRALGSATLVSTSRTSYAPDHAQNARARHVVELVARLVDTSGAVRYERIRRKIKTIAKF